MPARVFRGEKIRKKMKMLVDALIVEISFRFALEIGECTDEIFFLFICYYIGYEVVVNFNGKVTTLVQRGPVNDFQVILISRITGNKVQVVVVIYSQDS